MPLVRFGNLGCCIRSQEVVPNLRFTDLCDRGTLRRVRLCLTTPY